MSKADSDLMRRKCQNVFDIIDTNNNGVITSDDLDRFVDRIASGFGQAPGSPKHAAFATANQPWREAMQSMLDTDANESRSSEDYFNFWANTSDEQIRQFLDPWVDGLFTLADDDGDERLSRREFVGYTNALGIPAEEMEGIYETLDTDGSGYLSREEFGRYMNESAMGIDPDAPGNALYGRAPVTA